MKRLVILSALAAAAWAQPVAKVIDGDTFELTDGTKVRLDCIDAPELEQAGGAESRGFLAGLLSGQTVKVDKKGSDKYGRTLGEVTVGSTGVNLRMVEAGQAWRYVDYCQDPRYAVAEKSAQSAHAGVWASANPVAPWEFRLGQAAPVAAMPAETVASPETPKNSDASGRRKLMRGPKGGCYYLTASGSKRYVDRSLCN